jgi:hypothetical protein
MPPIRKAQTRYRILYEVDEVRQTVWILNIRHGALQDLIPEQFGGLRTKL